MDDQRKHRQLGRLASLAGPTARRRARGGRRYENVAACGGALGHALRVGGWGATVGFHELFHYDHAASLAATVRSYCARVRMCVCMHACNELVLCDHASTPRHGPYG